MRYNGRPIVEERRRRLLRYFGPVSRPPSPSAPRIRRRCGGRAVRSRIGNSTRPRNLSITPRRATWTAPESDPGRDDSSGLIPRFSTSRRLMSPTNPGPTRAGRLDRGVGEDATVEVLEGRLCRDRRGQDLGGRKRSRSRGTSRSGARWASSRFVRSSISTPALAARPRSASGNVTGVSFHHEREHVAALLAAEAFPGVAARGDRERRRLLAVEGAQALEGRARLLQLDRLADHVEDVQPTLDLCRNAACRLDRLPHRGREVPDMTVGLSSLDKPWKRILRLEAAS